MKALSSPILLLLFLTPAMIAVGQVLFKITSQKIIENTAPFYQIFFQPVFIIALAIYASATLIWVYVLKSVPLAYAYSFMAMTFVFVPLLAAWWLGEPVSPRYAIGATLIIAGLVTVHL